MASDGYDFDAVVQRQAGANLAAGAQVSPQNATDALAVAPKVGVPAVASMSDPAPWQAQAQANANSVTLRASPSVSSFVASDPAKAAAVKDDLGPLARVASTLHQWDALASTDFFAPGTQALHSFITDFGRAFAQTGEGGLPSPENAKAAGSTLWDALGVLSSPFSGALNLAARPLSYLPTYKDVGLGGDLRGMAAALQGVSAHPQLLSQPSAQAQIANEIGVALLPLGTPGLAAFRRAATEGGEAAGAARIEGPPPTDAEFSPVPPPGVSPEHSPIYSAVADMDATGVARLQEDLTNTATLGRSPALTEDFLENHTLASGRSVSVPAQAIADVWAQGHSPFADLAPQVQDAITTGGDVSVPLSQYLTETAGQPFAEALNAQTRFRENGVSQEEAKTLPQAAEGGEGGTGAEAEKPSPIAANPPEELADHPEVREAAARAEGAVRQVFAEQGIDKLFADPKALGLTAPQMEKYGAALDEAMAQVHDRVLQRTYSQLKRERTPEWKAQVEERALRIAGEQEGLPVVRAHNALSQPGFKLDRDLTENFFPGSYSRLDKSVLRQGGNHPDDAADVVGYPSGGRLVSDLADLHEAVRGSGAGNVKAYLKQTARAAAESEARYELGYDTSPESLLAAAHEEMVAPQIEDLLTKDLSAFAEANGLPFRKEDVAYLAGDQFNKLTVAEGIKPRAFAENMRRLGNKAESALLDSNPVPAFRAKQQQLLQYLQMKESFAFAKEFAKADSAMRKVARSPTNSKMDQTARNHLRAIVAQLGYHVRTGKFEDVVSALKGQNLTEYGKALTARGQPVYITDVPQVGEKGVRGLSVETFRDLDAMQKSIAQLGRDEKTVEIAGKKQVLADLAAEIKANADAIGRPYTVGEQQLGRQATTALDALTPEGRVKLGYKLKEFTRHASQSIGAANTRAEVPLFWLDREANGPLMQSIVNPLNEGTYYKAEKIQAMSAALKEFVAAQPKGWAKSLNVGVDVPELNYGLDARGRPVPWLNDKGNVIRAALHFGTEDNFANLVEGFGWDPQAVVDAVHRTLTEADWKYVQFLWDQADALWPETKELYRSTVGLAPKEVPGRGVPTPFGELRGKYWHLDYDWNALGDYTTPEGEKVEVHDPMSLGTSDLFGDKYRVSTPPNGSTKQRTQFRGPLNLDHSTLHRELESVIHDLAFRKPLIQAAKVLRQPAVRQAIRESLGPEYQTRMGEWLQQIARGSSYDQTTLKGLAGMLRGLRRRFTTVQIGYNFLTLAKHGGIAASHMLGEAGARLPQAVSDLLRDGDHWTKFIDENSGEVRNTLMSLDRDVREVMEKNFARNGFLSGWTYHATTMFAIVKRAEAQATWLAKYRETYEAGENHGDAAALANKAVRDTQGSGTVVNLTALQAGDGGLGGEALKLFNIFSSFENTTTNRAWTMLRRQERIGQTSLRLRGKPNGRGFDGFKDSGDAGNRRDKVRNLAQLLSFVIIPPVLLTGLDEITGKHGEKAAQRLAEHFMQGTLGGALPFGNTLAEGVQAVATKGRDTGGDNALISMLKALGGTTSAAWDAASHKPIADHRWVQHAIDTVGYAMDWPVKPFERAGQFAYDKSNGRVPPGALNDVLGLAFGPGAANETKSHSPSSEAKFK